MTTYAVTYSAEDGAQATRTFPTLDEASQYAATLVYGITGEPYAGFPVALDVYPVQDSDGRNHTVSVVEVEAPAPVVSDHLVARLDAQASRFASKARAAGNGARTVDVAASTEPARVPSLSPTYSVTVTVTDPGVECVVATWSVPTESRPGTRRGVRFFGWSFPVTGGGTGRRMREPMAWMMVTR